jgi:hypothetical protein
MSYLFDKVTGTSSSFTSSGIIDITKTWQINQFQNWYVTIENIEYLIESNTETELVFSNTFITNKSYEISFVGRTKLTELESDASDVSKITSDLISKKYSQANKDIHAKVFSGLRTFINESFDPMENIKNIYVLQQIFSYYILSKIYQDLSISEDSFESFKGYNMYEKSYNNGVRDAIGMLQIDFNQSGVVDASEKRSPATTMAFFCR